MATCISLINWTDKGIGQFEDTVERAEAASSVDMIFTSDAYHHFIHHRDMLASMREALKESIRRRALVGRPRSRRARASGRCASD